MLNAFIVIISGIGGAHLMTLFLRVINRYIPHGVRVPLILSQVVHHYFNGAPLYRLKDKNKYGQVIHLAVGVFFAFCYYALWRIGIGGPNFWTVILFGLVNGLLGMLGWFVFLRSTFEPEQVNEREFYPVIVFAHIAFALGVTVIYFGTWSLIR